MSPPVFIRATTCAMALLMAALSLPNHVARAASPALALPKPSGPHTIGSRLFHWIDTSRAEEATEDPDDHRELFVQIWYPSTEPAERAHHTPYLRSPEAYASIFGEDMVHRLRQIQTHSFLNSPPDPSIDDLPIILFSHGWQAQGSAYTALLEDLASHGYLVAGIDQPFQGRIALANGTVTPATEAHFKDPMEMVSFYGKDQQFVLDRLRDLGEEGGIFSGRLATGRAGSMGHSNGALATLQAAKVDSRIRASLLLDKWDPIFESIFQLETPLFLLRTGDAPEPNPAYIEAAASAVQDAVLPGGDHLSASDWPLLRATNALGQEGAVDMLREIQTKVVAFFDRHL